MVGWICTNRFGGPKAQYNRWVMCVAVPFDHHLFHLCTVPLSLDSEPSLPHLMDRVAAVIPPTVGPSPTRLDGKMVPSFPCLILIVCTIPNVLRGCIDITCMPVAGRWGGGGGLVKPYLMPLLLSYYTHPGRLLSYVAWSSCLGYMIPMYAV